MTDDDFEEGWRLEGQDGAGRAISVTVGGAELTRSYLGVTLGRHPDLNQRVIDDPSVSRRHLRLGRAAGGLFVEDLNSLNGSWLDGAELRPFTPAPIAPGQTLELGRVTLRLVTLAEAARAEREEARIR